MDLKKCNLPEDLAQNRMEWKTEFMQLAQNSWDKALLMMTSKLELSRD